MKRTQNGGEPHANFILLQSPTRKLSPVPFASNFEYSHPSRCLQQNTDALAALQTVSGGLGLLHLKIIFQPTSTCSNSINLSTMAVYRIVRLPKLPTALMDQRPTNPRNQWSTNSTRPTTRCPNCDLYTARSRHHLGLPITRRYFEHGVANQLVRLELGPAVSYSPRMQDLWSSSLPSRTTGPCGMTT